MPQFGTGPELAAQCPVAPIPEGWRYWVDADGPVPAELTKRAQALIADAAVPLGTTESYPLPGVTTMLRIEPHAWSRDAQGGLVQGCFRAAGIYLPSGTPEGAAASSSKWEKAVTVLTVASLVVGIGATLWGWGKS